MNMTIENVSALRKSPNVFELGVLRNDNYESVTRAFLIDPGGAVKIKNIRRRVK